jgi:Ca-activated chloride channel family protein
MIPGWPEFENPHALWLLLLIPPYLWWTRRRVTTPAMRYPSIRSLKRLPRTFRQRCQVVPPALRAIALGLLVIVLARPIRQIETQELPARGIGIALLVDESGSMGDPQNKLKYEGDLQLRMDVARDVVQKFIAGDGRELTGRPDDLIGLMTFATYPETAHPFSLDHQSLLNAAKQLEAQAPFLDELGRPTNDIQKAALQTDAQGRPLRDMFGRPAPRLNPLQYTDIEKALEYAAGKLQLLENDLSRPAEGLRPYHLESKVIVLLTDGEPTVADARQRPDYASEEMIEQLTKEGIRVHYIQILSRERYRERPDGTVEVMVPRRGGLFGQAQAAQETRVVNETIEQARTLARRTGGQHFLATSGDQLKEVYARIDEMERSDIGGRTVFSHEERYWSFLATGLVLLGAELLLGLTWLRRTP